MIMEWTSYGGMLTVYQKASEQEETDVQELLVGQTCIKLYVCLKSDHQNV